MVTQAAVSGARREPGTAVLLPSSGTWPGHLLWASGLHSPLRVSMGSPEDGHSCGRAQVLEVQAEGKWELSRDLTQSPGS